MKQNKKLIILAIIIIVAIATILLVTRAFAVNTGGTVRDRMDEKTFVRMTATSAKLKNSATELNVDMLKTEMESLIGTNSVTVVDKSSDIILVTFLATGNNYEINKRNGVCTENISISTISLDKTTAEVEKGDTIDIIATLNEGAEENVIWESSNESIATVVGSGDNMTVGTITGVELGTTTITAKNTDGTVSATCEVTVTDPMITFSIANAEYEGTYTVPKGTKWNEFSCDKFSYVGSGNNMLRLDRLGWALVGPRWTESDQCMEITK